jgi:hypothetical protein
MVYALIGDELMEQLEALGISRNARLLYIEGLTHCSRLLTDGLITIQIRRLGDAPQPNKATQELVDAGVWKKVENGFQITDYLKTQRSSDEVTKDRERVARNQRRSRLHKQGDHSLCSKSRVCPNGVLDWDGQPLQGDSAIVTGDTPRPIQSNPIQSEPKARIGEIETKEADAIAFTPKGRERYASVMKEVHIFVDYKSTGICHLCEEGEKWKFHQKNVPAKFQAIAAGTAEAGIPWEFIDDGHDEFNYMENPDQDQVSFDKGRADFISLNFDLPKSFTELNAMQWFNLYQRLTVLANRNYTRARITEAYTEDKLHIQFKPRDSSESFRGQNFVSLARGIEGLLNNTEWLNDTEWLKESEWSKIPDWLDAENWFDQFTWWIQSDEFLQAANADPDKYRGVLSLVNHEKVQARLNRGQE